MEVIAKWFNDIEAQNVLREWGYNHYLGLIGRVRCGGAYDDGVLTRVLIVRFEVDDTVRFIAYAEKNPKSTLVEAIEAARTLYGRTPKKIYAVCNTVEGAAAIDYLIENHPDAVEGVEISKTPAGERIVAYTRKISS